MVSLASVSNRWRTDSFLTWDPVTETFVEGFSARIFRVDRFKSIYTRPVHRAQITLDPVIPLPSSLVVKHVATGIIYLVSEIRRQDSIDNELYDGVVTLHMTSSGSGGYAELYRYATAGAGDNLGPLIQSQLVSTYIDLELRTVATDSMGHDEFVGHYFATTPVTSGIEVDDFLVLNAMQYRVDEVYHDSGYRMARVVREDYDKENLTYHLPQGSGASYSPGTKTYTNETVADRVFSGAVAVSQEADVPNTPIGERMLDVYIDFAHIGFTPEREHTVTYNGVLYKIKSVRIAAEKKQWLLKLGNA